MQKIVSLLFVLVSFSVVSQNTSSDTNKKESITLQEFVAKIKMQNESIKNVDQINVMVNDLLIENLQEYRIDPKSVSKLEVLVLDPKGASRERTKPSIIITTKIVK